MRPNSYDDIGKALLAAEAQAAAMLAERVQLLAELERLRAVADAVRALAHPDGIIRSPLIAGPELVAVNAALAAAKEVPRV